MGLMGFDITPSAIQLYSLIVRGNNDGKITIKKIKEKTALLNISEKTLKRRIQELTKHNIICRINKGVYGFVYHDFDLIYSRVKNDPTMVGKILDHREEGNKDKIDPIIEPTIVEKTDDLPMVENRVKSDPIKPIGSDMTLHRVRYDPPSSTELFDSISNEIQGRSPAAPSKFQSARRPEQPCPTQTTQIKPKEKHCSTQTTLVGILTKDKTLSAELKDIVEFYHYDVVKTKIPGVTKKAWDKTVLYLHRLIKGSMYDGISDFKDWHNHPFTVDDIFNSIMRHKKALRSDYKPTYKDPLRRYLYEFIYNPMQKEKSYFLRWHIKSPERLIKLTRKSKNPILENIFLDYFKINGDQPKEREKVIEHSERLIQFFNSQNMRKLSPKEMGGIVIDCVEDSLSPNLKLRAGHIASPRTLGLLSTYLDDKGFTTPVISGGVDREALKDFDWDSLEVEDTGDVINALDQKKERYGI